MLKTFYNTAKPLIHLWLYLLIFLGYIQLLEVVAKILNIYQIGIQLYEKAIPYYALLLVLLSIYFIEKFLIRTNNE